MAKKNTNPYGSINKNSCDSIAFLHNSIKSLSGVFKNPKSGFAYGRIGIPIVEKAQKFLAEIEKMPNGNALAHNAGLLSLDQLVKALCAKRMMGNRRIVAAPNIYGGSYHQLTLWRDDFGFDVRFVKDPLKLSSWDETIRCKPDFVFLETLTNPTLDVFPISAIAKLCHKYGTILVADNTLGITLQYPLALGADAVLHSATKYLIRDSSGLGGVLVGTLEFMQKYGEILKEYSIYSGAIMSPQSARIILKNGSKLAQHMQQFSHNALALAEVLEKHSKVLKVNYPFLPSNRGYALAQEQMTGGSGVLSFEVENSQVACVIVEALKKVSLTAHLGDKRYLVTIPSVTTHSALSPEELASAGIKEGLIRVSVGLSNVAPIIEDFAQAIDTACGISRMSGGTLYEVSLKTMRTMQARREIPNDLEYMRNKARKKATRRKPQKVSPVIEGMHKDYVRDVKSRDFFGEGRGKKRKPKKK